MVKIKYKVIITAFLAVILAAAAGGYTYYRMTHFNENVEINDISVGKMNADEALAHLKKQNINNNVYLDGKLLFRGKETASGFTTDDSVKIRSLLKKQWTWLPTKKAISYQVVPSNMSTYRKKILQPTVKNLLEKKNQTLKKAVDAQAALEDGKIVVSEPQKGKQYNVKTIMRNFSRQSDLSKINLKGTIEQPLTASSKKVATEKSKLAILAKRSVSYKVQQTNYNLAAKDVLSKATYKNGRYQIDQTGIIKEVEQINQKQATLKKDINFKNHDGEQVTVPGGTYGWALKPEDAVKSISTAFIKGEEQIDASKDIYGVGYLTYGTGYENTANDGLGTTYAEVSLSKQRAWFYKDGKEVYSTEVVTGKHSTNEDTPKGVWYVMYKESPSTLKGSEAGNSNYSVKVNYWAQFTNSGCGFHDASWRTDWSSTAYLNNGSGGCVNTPSDHMKNVYDNLAQSEAVVVY
ncbi:L,D-transpeptidase [Liquorilactobacillus oeni]|uniref:ErfK YbiS YcfS YnhG family protein n=1 Tax=Liquorilactobacillus oeni DSM 19972 TaxID=1423777 RepID=A0A0R1MJA7_9LACO|nr:L,D-transpeptidase [Liquorilactobacillus oeni]KRL03944.1 ErfK YbiS YcfS YnhG family protein [Liquorilactobacillus oeni DSM 19972]